MNLTNFSDTRWTTKKECLNRIVQGYSSVMSLFERSAPVETVSDMKCCLYGMLYQMEKFEFFFGLCLSVETLAVTDLLATQLQQKDLSAYEGKELAKKAIITLNALKLEFSKFWEETQEKAENWPQISPSKSTTSCNIESSAET